MSESKKIEVKMKISSSMKSYIAKRINSNFKNEDLEIGFMEIKNDVINGSVYFKHPPENKIVKVIIKKSELNLLKEEYREILPNLIYFV